MNTRLLLLLAALLVSQIQLLFAQSSYQRQQQQQRYQQQQRQQQLYQRQQQLQARQQQLQRQQQQLRYRQQQLQQQRQTAALKATAANNANKRMAAARANAVRRKTILNNSQQAQAGINVGRNRALAVSKPTSPVSGTGPKTPIPLAKSSQVLQAKAALRTNQLNRLRASLQTKLQVRRLSASTGSLGGESQRSPTGGGSGGKRPPGGGAGVAKTIANGHAFDKHKAELASVGINNQQEFEEIVDHTIQKASGNNVKTLARGRVAYWNAEKNLIVIHDPLSPDQGTAFIPRRGRAYFDEDIQ